MPVHGFLHETNLRICDEFREGNASPYSGQKGFYIEYKRRMPEASHVFDPQRLVPIII